MTEEHIILDRIRDHIERCCKHNLVTKQAFKDYVDNIWVDDTKYVAAKYLKSMRVFKEPKLISVYRLVKEPDLYETLIDVNVPVDWFAFAVLSYIYSVADFDKTPLLSRYYQWQQNSDKVAQNYFNEFIKLATEKLAVFYD